MEPSPPTLGAPCPACGAPGARPIHALAAVPIHSCVLLEDAERARAFPSAPLRIAHCAACDFVFNAAFDPARMDYSEDYEETQGCSPTFARWLGALAAELAARLELGGKRIVEVGCGRGDFLAALCRAAGAEGVGIDPSGTAGRVDRSAGRGLSFLRAEYGPEHAGLAPALLACRHTLEHLGDVAGFLRLARGNLEHASGASFFLEVPDVQPQLEQGAFWDFYYEHASYFSAGSLAGALARAGFEVLELRSSYGGQYLQALARPARGERALPPPAAPPLGPLVEDFATRCAASLRAWEDRLAAARAAGRRVVLWGAGSKATGFLASLAGASAVTAVVDINPAKHGRYVAGAGQPIVAPAELPELAPELVVVMNPIYRQEIRAELARLGLAPELVALGD